MDWSRFSELVEKHFDCSDAAFIHPDDLVIGENLSPFPEVKLTFEGFGDLETDDDYVEGGDTNMRSFVLFIHKNSHKENFEFPEHEVAAFTFGRMIMHRPKEELHVYGWYDAKYESWYINTEGVCPAKGEMTAKRALKILEVLDKRYWSETDETEPEQKQTRWPFPLGRP
jgi:hypothetical protein